MPVFLVLLVSVVVLVLVRAYTTGPASVARVDGFISRHRLDVSDAGRAYVQAYLTTTRRYRLSGVVIAAIVLALYGAPRGHIQFDADFLLCGWLIGAWLAEVELAKRNAGGPGARVVPGWLIRLPYAVGIACLAAGGALLTVTTGHVVRWTFLALLVLGATARAVVTVESRRGPLGDDETKADHAVRARSVAALTAVGVVIAILFLLRAWTSAADASVGVAAEAGKGMSVVWSIGATLVGLAIARVGSWAQRPDTPRLERPSTHLVGLTVVLVLTTVGWFGTTWAHDHPPYGPDAVQATAVVKFTDEAHAAADVKAYGDVGLNPPLGGPEDQILVGRVSFSEPPRAHGAGTYYLILIDKRTNSPVENIYGADGSGWNGFMGADLPRRYPWLSSVAPRQVGNDEWTDTAMSVSVDPTERSKAFVALIPDGTGISVDDLLIALVFVGTDNQIYWATPVPIMAAV